MHDNWLNRTKLLLGDNNLEKLQNSKVLVAGLGGVGAYAAEMLCRAGIGTMTLIDSDTIDETNRNRQLPALISTTGMYKTKVLAERFQDINPNVKLTLEESYINEESGKLILNKNFNYVVDAIDTLSPKAFLINYCIQNGIPVISSMGAGGKLDPSKVQIADISQTHHCMLAKALRQKLSKYNIKKGFKVIFSPEMTRGEILVEKGMRNRKSTVGTISYMPAIFGCYLAAAVIRDLVESNNSQTISAMKDEIFCTS